MPQDINFDDLLDDADTSFFDDKDEELGCPDVSERVPTGDDDGAIVDPKTGEMFYDLEQLEKMEKEEGLQEKEELPLDLPDPDKSTETDGERILDQLLDAIRHKDVGELCNFGRSYAEMDYENDFAVLVAEVHSIVNRYREKGFAANLSSSPDDLIQLSGLLVTLAEPLGFLEGAFEDANEIKKLALSAFYLEAKKYRVEGWKLTDKDAENISRRLSQPYTEQAGKAAIYARMLRNLWYGLRHFTDMLNATMIRAGTEMRFIERSEGAAFRNNMVTMDHKKGFEEDCKAMQRSIEGWDEYEVGSIEV